MKESQTKGDRMLDERMTRSADNIMSDQSDKEYYKESSFAERARRQREIYQESAAQFNGLSAPARSTSARPQTSPEQPIEQDSAMAEAVASEEETEQEEDSVMQVPKSQEAPQSSTEEDKENFNEPLDAAAAASAHERLSQVLGYQPVETPSREHFDVENSDAIGHQRALASQSNGQINGMVRYSQVMVKHSQPSVVEGLSTSSPSSAASV
ncbi:unnamed protein product [Penicillium viridicatum]